ncbi:Beta-xylosidase [Evansella caseinilytica]|uniref:Beta-xylosidase n=1 Tax=Evansella caseinilytica TaxID=1503961 RepID=A0A1H3NUS5_9BACI|nr:glycoside hydrolase 43 family protein [Evansella caseinilytica]SDY92215.1 Beta-xylosidase [Evansella caseinilytica]
MGKITMNNPLIWADVPDPSVIRVNSTYYMVSTSMHSMPGCPIMKSNNLRDWQLVNYVFETLEGNDAHNLKDGHHIYGKGSWAACLRYHNGVFYVCFSSNDMNQFYVYTTNNIEQGPWERHVIDGLYHDPSLLFDQGRVFVIHGNGRISITELTEDATARKRDGVNQLLFETESEGIGLRCEGCHAYKLNGYYYLFFIEWPSTGNRRRRQLCYRSEDLFGPYERKIILDDDMDYDNQGVAQGGIVETAEGEWYAILFQDHGAVGRVPVIVPLMWSNNWPLLGINGKVPKSFAAQLPHAEQTAIVSSDEFDYQENRLGLKWQWNHNPDNALWSFTARRGFLRLEAGHLAKSVEYARNTLTQRTEGPRCSAATLMDLRQMKPGDKAGLVALQHHFGTIGVEIADNREKWITMSRKGEDGLEEKVESIPFHGERIYLKMSFNFIDNTDAATFAYSEDGENWRQLGTILQLRYTLDHFMGCRIGLYNYATKQPGGIVDFAYFRYEKW